MTTNRTFYIFSLLFLIFISIMISVGSKTSLGIAIAIFFVLIYAVSVSKSGLVTGSKYLLYIVILTIPFPYLFQVAGKDAMTITTLMIYVLFTIILLIYLLHEKKLFIKLRIEFIMPVLIFVNLSLSLMLNPLVLGQSFRHYVASTSGILLYFIILAIVKKQSDIINIIKIIVLLLIIQAGVCVMELKFPNMINYFVSLFQPRVFIPAVYVSDGFLRATGTIWDYELLAEWFLIGSILSMFLVYETGKFRYYLAMLCCIAGIIFTKTRSIFSY